MEGTEFQSEAMTTVIPRLEIHGCTPPVNGQAVRTVLASLALTLRLRKDLTTDETNRLGLLTESGSQCFLYHNGRFYCSSPLPCMTEDVVKTAVQSGSGAIFSRHTAAGENPESVAYYVQSAVLDPGQADPIVLGLVSPTTVIDRSQTQRTFSCLIHHATASLAIVRGLENELSGLLVAESPVLIINRASGRIIAVNESCCTFFECPAQDLNDREFCDVKRDISQKLAMSSLSMRNISRDDLHLTIISLTPRAAQEKSSAVTLNEFFDSDLRHRLTAISTAATQFSTISAGLDNDDLNFLADVVVKQSSDMEQMIARRELLFNFNQQPQVDVVVTTALRCALDQPVGPAVRLSGIDVSYPDPSFRISAPEHSLTFLFDAIIHAHRSSCPATAHTLIASSASPDSGILGMRWETRCQPDNTPAGLHEGWRTVADRLAELLSLDLKHSVDTGSMRLITALFIPVAPRSDA
jgi:hypothetical protein